MNPEIGDFQERLPGQFALDAQCPLLHVGLYEVMIDKADVVAQFCPDTEAVAGLLCEAIRERIAQADPGDDGRVSVNRASVRSDRAEGDQGHRGALIDNRAGVEDAVTGAHHSFLADRVSQPNARSEVVPIGFALTPAQTICVDKLQATLDSTQIDDLTGG